MAAAEDVIRRVEASLASDPRVEVLKHPLRVAFDTDGAVVLEGELPTIVAKKLALEHAAAIPDVTGIIDRLRVTPTRVMGDGEIRDHVRNALLEEPTLDSCTVRAMASGRWETWRQGVPESRCSIDVKVDDGIVTLDGQVTSLSQKRLVGVLAWWVPGSRDVINGLEVSPTEEDSDDEITEAVKLVLEKDPLINASRIRVTTRGAVVTLEGLVANSAEREMAESDTWYVFGVDRVINRLECRSKRGQVPRSPR